MESKAKIKADMSLEEAKAWRATLYRPVVKPLSEDKKREAFRIYWTSQRSAYGRGKNLEKALYLHLKAIGMNTPDRFEEGLKNFGLVKVSK